MNKKCLPQGLQSSINSSRNLGGKFNWGTTNKHPKIKCVMKEVLE